MKHAVGLAALLVFGFSFSGCGRDTPESLMAEAVEVSKDLNSELTGIRTVEDLKKAEGRIKKLIRRQKALDEKMKALGVDKMPMKERNALMQEHFADMSEVLMGLMGNFMRLGVLSATDPEAARIMTEIQPGGG